MTTIPLLATVHVNFGEIKTVISAQRAIINASADIRWYGPDHPDCEQWVSDIEALLMAITVTTGEPQESILERLATPIDRAFVNRKRESIKHALRCGWSRAEVIRSDDEA